MILKRALLFGCVLLIGLAGCSSDSATPAPVAAAPAATAADHSDHEHGTTDDVTSALAKLSDEDRALAVSQKFCAVSESSPLGSMGAPIKVEIEGQPVFLCCEGCRSKALDQPAETLAAVDRLREANAPK